MVRRLAAIMVADMYGYSRLMEADEARIITRQKAHRKELIDHEIARSNGRIIKTTGDGWLAEFDSVQDAVQCAVEIQNAMAIREAEIDHDHRIMYRVGINVGDVAFEDGDVYGDGVNVAARLEALAEPGGVCVSDLAYQLVREKLDAPFVDMGAQRVKNISRPIGVWQWTPTTLSDDIDLPSLATSQRVGFCPSSDGTLLAWSTIGDGPPLLKAPNWMNHIEYEWRVPLWQGLYEELASRFELTRFDQRGNGLSDWDVVEISFDRMIDDMSAIVDAANLDTFGLFGLSQGCTFSIRYAVENPERVRYLVLLGGYTRGMARRESAEQEALLGAMDTMIRQGWGSPLPTYRQMFTTQFMPDATPEQAATFDELMRVSATPENAARIFNMNNDIDVSDLATQVQVPTIVFHCRDETRNPFEEGRRMAAQIPGAQFVALESKNHIPHRGSSEFDELFNHLDRFIAKLPE